jgi:hypothetical protein
MRMIISQLRFLVAVVSDDERTKRLNDLVLSAAVGVSLMITAFAILLLAFGSSRASIRISEVHGSFASVVAAVTAVARVVKGSRRRR